jgi:hypothetical protein
MSRVPGFRQTTLLSVELLLLQPTVAHRNVDFQSNLQLFNTLPPTTRNRYTVLLFFVIGCVLLTVALGAGLPMLGRVYNYNIPVAVPQNGMLEGPTQVRGATVLL